MYEILTYLNNHYVKRKQENKIKASTTTIRWFFTDREVVVYNQAWVEAWVEEQVEAWVEA